LNGFTIRVSQHFNPLKFMKRYRNQLPQLQGDLFLSDGGLETTLIFHENLSLPHFAAFDLLKNEQGTGVLRRYYQRYAELARSKGVGVVLESPTWRANPDWAMRLGYDADALANANRKGIELLEQVRGTFDFDGPPIVISGNFGPRGDGYRADTRMTVAEAQAYHTPQMEVFAGSNADMTAAFTMTYTEEAVGIALAARASGMPVVISFTLETDGRLPSGDSLADAIQRTDAETGAYPAHYMIN